MNRCAEKQENEKSFCIFTWTVLVCCLHFVNFSPHPREQLRCSLKALRVFAVDWRVEIFQWFHIWVDLLAWNSRTELQRLNNRSEIKLANKNVTPTISSSIIAVHILFPTSLLQDWPQKSRSHKRHKLDTIGTRPFMPLRNELVFVALAQLSCDFESYFACSFVSYHRNANKTFSLSNSFLICCWFRGHRRIQSETFEFSTLMFNKFLGKLRMCILLKISFWIGFLLSFSKI